jgi:uncharacterized protein
MNGTLLVVEAVSLPEVEAFIKYAPFVKAGFFTNVQSRHGWQLTAPPHKPVRAELPHTAPASGV